jgi:ATP-dependent Lon protease
LPSLALKEVRIADDLVRENERMLTDGFYAEVTLSYDPIVAQEFSGWPFAIDTLRPIQMSKSDALDVLARGQGNSQPRNGLTCSCAQLAWSQRVWMTVRNA